MSDVLLSRGLKSEGFRNHIVPETSWLNSSQKVLAIGMNLVDV